MTKYTEVAQKDYFQCPKCNNLTVTLVSDDLYACMNFASATGCRYETSRFNIEKVRP
jgi:ribosomal protein L37AE/L43A